MRLSVVQWFFHCPYEVSGLKVMDRGSASDWQVVPEDDWNYALDLSAGTKDSIRVIEREGTGGAFTESGASVHLIMRGSKVSQ